MFSCNVRLQFDLTWPCSQSTF